MKHQKTKRWRRRATIVLVWHGRECGIAAFSLPLVATCLSVQIGNGSVVVCLRLCHSNKQQRVAAGALEPGLFAHQQIQHQAGQIIGPDGLPMAVNTWQLVLKARELVVPPSHPWGRLG